MNSVIEEANRQLAQIAREHHAEYLDIYSLFLDEKGNVMERAISTTTASI